MQIPLTDGPLGDEVSQFLGDGPMPPGGTWSEHHFAHWITITFGDPVRRLQFLARLSAVQKKAHLILEEYIRHIVDANGLVLDTPDAIRRLLTLLHERLGSQYPPSAVATQAHPYYARMDKLLNKEFTPPDPDVDLYMGSLTIRRRTAARHASCFRIGWCFYKSFLPNTSGSISPPEELPTSSFSPQQATQGPYGCSVDPCNWLPDPPEGAASLPVYLWDIKTQCTRKVADIIREDGLVPEYFTISHTWGRWIDEAAELVELPGVPWKIPPNTKFSVAELPETLKRLLPLGCRFVWLDLLTIPQITTSAELENIKDSEISRQGTIFRRAKATLCWLNDIRSWDVLTAVVRYLGLNYLAAAPLPNVGPELLSLQLNEASALAEEWPEFLANPLTRVIPLVEAVADELSRGLEPPREAGVLLHEDLAQEGELEELQRCSTVAKEMGKLLREASAQAGELAEQQLDPAQQEVAGFLQAYSASIKQLAQEAGRYSSLVKSVAENLVPRLELPEYLWQPLLDNISGVMESLDRLSAVIEFREAWPNAWFTSLWTLQEVCLRPDMLLCTVDWELLKAGPLCPISLDDINALTVGTLEKAIGVAAQTTGLDAESGLEKIPAGARVLTNAMTELGLENLQELPALSILTLASRRRCKERRAEAIMSALGATNWFRNLSREKREDNLVMGLYPMPFVEEIRQKLGSGHFFSTMPVTREFDSVLLRFCSGKASALEATGSLLPFGPGVAAVDFFSNELRRHMADHPALDAWVIEPTGSVRIRSAGIVAVTGSRGYCCSNNEDNKEIKCLLAGPGQRNGKHRMVYYQSDETDLDTWVQSYQPDSRNYAVCLLHSSRATQGILLKEIQEGIMLKVGVYVQFDPTYPIPSSEEVDWLVL